jgi:hypothetical protein
LLGAAALIAAGGLLYAAVSRFASTPGEVRPELRQLVTAVGQRRTFQPRLTGGFEYSQVVATPPTRSARSADAGLSLEVRAAAIELEKRAGTQPSSMNAFGIAQLVTGQSERAVAMGGPATRDRRRRRAGRRALDSSCGQTISGYGI